MALTDNLIAHYKFNDNTNDEVNSYNGTPTSITYNSGKFGNASVFNGSSSNISLPSQVYGFSSGTKQYSFACLVYITSNPSVNYTIYSSIENPANSGYYRSFTIVINSAGKLIVQRAGYPNNYSSKISTNSVTLNSWNLCVARYDGSNLSVSLNGSTLENLSSTFSSTNPTVGKFGIWQESNANYYPMNGRIDSASFWSRAITQSEITDLYNSGSFLDYPFAGGGGPTPNFFPFLLAHAT